MKRDFRQMRVFIEALLEAGRDTLVQLATNVKERMSEEGKSVTYPIEWDSERQRRYVMWKQKGQPYRRTNRYRFGWELERGRFGARLSNRSPAGAIGGIPSGWQSRIHRGRWPHLLTVLFDELAKVPADVSNRLKVVGEKFR